MMISGENAGKNYTVITKRTVTIKSLVGYTKAYGIGNYKYVQATITDQLSLTDRHSP